MRLEKFINTLSKISEATFDPEVEFYFSDGSKKHFAVVDDVFLSDRSVVVVFRSGTDLVHKAIEDATTADKSANGNSSASGAKILEKEL